MVINARQVPKIRSITTEKDYCDLLYAWLQCNSERVSGTPQRKIEKKKVKWQSIEKDFTREVEGVQEKIMGRKAIAKYFTKLQEMDLIQENEEDPKFYYITVLNTEDASLIEYRTLGKLLNVMQRRSISIYAYLYSRYCANSRAPFVVTMSQIKDFVGISTSTTSNNSFIVDTYDILARLGLLNYQMVYQDGKTLYQINWVKNELPGLEELY